jgi:hypothetical protein
MFVSLSVRKKNDMKNIKTVVELNEFVSANLNALVKGFKSEELYQLEELSEDLFETDIEYKEERAKLAAKLDSINNLERFKVVYEDLTGLDLDEEGIEEHNTNNLELYYEVAQ